MGYTGVPYAIKSGDTLWDIAAEKLGDPYAWPRIYAFNNDPDVIRAGARRIEDPDLIYAGATLMLPLVPGTVPAPIPSATRPAPKGSLKDQIPDIKLPLTFAYDIKSNSITLDYGTFVARITLKGRILLNLGNPLPLTTVINGGYEVSSKVQAENAFSTLMSKNTVSFDPATKGIKFSNKLITSATNINSVKTGVGLEISSTTGIPVLKTEIIYPELKGTLGNDKFTALNFKVEIEIEPRPPKLTPQPVYVPVYEPVSSPTRAPDTDWGKIAREASGWALAAVIVIGVAYGASVVFSGGATGAGAPAMASLATVILVGGATTTIAVQ